jgi:hypothetical protein
MTTKQAVDVVPGDCIRLASGREMSVTRIERDFLGVDTLVCFVEDTQRCWFAHAVFVTDEIVTISPAEPLDTQSHIR